SNSVLYMRDVGGQCNFQYPLTDRHPSNRADWGLPEENSKLSVSSNGSTSLQPRASDGCSNG
ncbi:MAG: hypothetical protein ACRDHZ_16630, partial [Ktedonobacteraceae bacterium]